MAKYSRRINVVVECRMNQRGGGGNKSRHGLKLCTAWVVRNGGLSCPSEGIGAAYKRLFIQLGFILHQTFSDKMYTFQKWQMKY